MGNIERARSRVEGLLKKILRTDRLFVDDSGAWTLRYGSAVYFIRVLPFRVLGAPAPLADKHLVQVFALVLADVPYSPQLLDAINQINIQIVFGRLAWWSPDFVAAVAATEGAPALKAADISGGWIVAFSELVAETANELELRVASETIAAIADTYDNTLQSQFGGMISFPTPDQRATEPTPIRITKAPEGRSAEDKQLSPDELAARMSASQASWELGRGILANQASGWQQPAFRI